MNELLYKLSKSKFRSSFKLKDKDIKYIDDKGLDVIKEHCINFIIERLKPKTIPNDAVLNLLFGVNAESIPSICI